MNNLPELQLITNDQTAFHSSCDERIEDYLEHLVAPLIGIVPYSERKAFRQEAHAHLDGLIRDYLWQGQDIYAATETALLEFGEPWKVGQAFLVEWLQATPAMLPARLIRIATCTAFAWFGVASMLTLLLLEQYIFVHSQNALLPCIALLALLAPFVAGGLAGMMCPAQVERGVRNAVCLLALHALVTGLLLLPRYEVLVYTAWLLLFWLPAGKISAAMVSRHLRQVRRQCFWLIAR